MPTTHLKEVYPKGDNRLTFIHADTSAILDIPPAAIFGFFNADPNQSVAIIVLASPRAYRPVTDTDGRISYQLSKITGPGNMVPVSDIRGRDMNAWSEGVSGRIEHLLNDRNIKVKRLELSDCGEELEPEERRLIQFVRKQPVYGPVFVVQ